MSLNIFFNKSLASSFTGKVLLEEFMVGNEGSVEALIQNGVPYIMGICSKEKSSLPYRYDLQLNYPGSYTEKQIERINTFIIELVKGFEIKNGIIHVEIMVDKNEVKLIEFAIRGCGSKVITHLMPAVTGFDVMDFLLYNALGINKKIKFKKNNFGILKFVMLPHGKIKNITGIEDVRKIKGVLDFDIERDSGNIIAQVEDGRSRPGYLLAYSSDKDKLKKIVEKAFSIFNVNYY